MKATSSNVADTMTQKQMPTSNDVVVMICVSMVVLSFALEAKGAVA
jgi:hypothetical protein